MYKTLKFIQIAVSNSNNETSLYGLTEEGNLYEGYYGKTKDNTSIEASWRLTWNRINTSISEDQN